MYTTASEIALLKYVRQPKNIPVPKVYCCSCDISNHVGAEYIIMEKAEGVSLLQKWGDIKEFDRLQLIKGLTKLEHQLSSVKFPAYGSLYFLPPPGDCAKYQAIEHASDSAGLYCIRPSCDRAFMSDSTARLTGLYINNGPSFLQMQWPVFLKPPVEYVKGIVKVKLPANFDALDPDEKAFAELEWEKSKLAKAYEVSSYLENTTRWESLGFTRKCLFSFNDADIEKHESQYQEYQDWNKVQELARECLDTDEEGWISPELDFDKKKEQNKELLDLFINQTAEEKSVEEARAMWPFSKHIQCLYLGGSGVPRFRAGSLRATFDCGEVRTDDARKEQDGEEKRREERRAIKNTIPHNPASLLASAAVPAFKCPAGTKMHILDLGTLEADESWLLRGANASTLSNKNPVNKRRKLTILSALIEYPGVGLILYETGCAEDLEVAWGAPLTDVFARTEYSDKQTLPGAIRAAGYDIKDVKAIIIGHLHLDHAGGLEHFVGTDVPIYVHEEEFKHACWAIATGADLGVYLGHYMLLEKLNWNTFPDSQLDLFQGIILHHSPGHTPGLCIMQVNLEKDGTFIWTSDQFHVKENYSVGHPHGGLARDHNAWYRSLQMIRRLQRLYNAKIVFGHDKEVADELIAAKAFYE
ncbi:hypothetical protein B7463_g9274, partial [Scytalidium lignicola]